MVNNSVGQFLELYECACPFIQHWWGHIWRPVSSAGVPSARATQPHWRQNVIIACAYRKRFLLLTEITIKTMQLWKWYLGIFKSQKAKQWHRRTHGEAKKWYTLHYLASLRMSTWKRMVLALWFWDISPPKGSVPHFCVCSLKSPITSIAFPVKV